ncbi:hypothetical protein V501_01832 [Pseudogymnoascus sp. VKM F-4519 (FW-2642)]|nr:hypothetical protein V501_01832 [Pseudogymnoascus sp. VKM F-4519 (FW-2642)]
MSTRDSFPQFSRLPLELRCLIWFHCLPRRIAEEDIPYTLLDGKRSRQACWPNRTTFKNARVPYVAAVSREARQTVFEWGQHQKSQDDTSLETIWLQPKVDLALHLNWTRRRNHAFYQVYDAYVPGYDETPLVMLIYRALWDYGMRISLVGDVIHPFDVGELMIDTATTTNNSPPSDSKPVASATPSIPITEVQDERAEDIYHIVTFAEDQTIYLTLVAISLHVDKAAALASGLFGLLGDAPVQTVDFDDVPRLRQFYKLYSSDPTLKEAEPHVEKLFNVILSREFHAAVLSWEKKIRWLLQVAAWKRIQKDQPESFGDTDPALVWKPPVPKEQRYMRMDEYMPDEENSWWGEYAGVQTPKVMPQVMVRLCDNQCYREERQPEKFGDVWFGEYRRGAEASL